MKKFLVSLLAATATLVPAPVEAIEGWVTDNRYMVETSTPSSQEEFNSVVEYVRENHESMGLRFKEFVALFEERDTPPSDREMYENAQFQRVVGIVNERYYYTASGDAYRCSIIDEQPGCYYDMTLNLRDVFLQTYKKTRLTWLGIDTVNGYCSLVRYNHTAEEKKTYVVGISRQGGAC